MIKIRKEDYNMEKKITEEIIMTNTRRRRVPIATKTRRPAFWSKIDEKLFNKVRKGYEK